MVPVPSSKRHHPTSPGWGSIMAACALLFVCRTMNDETAMIAQSTSAVTAFFLVQTTPFINNRSFYHI